MLKAPGFWVGVLVLLGAGLRLGPLVGDPLHQDEALYGFWGRLISAGRDPWLATVPVDKPPLVLYLIAGGQSAFGVSEFTLRMPGLAASLLSIPLIYALGCRLYGDRTAGLMAAVVMALTPYPVLFGATAFTDSVLVVLWLAACYAAVIGHWGWAGLLWGLGFASKQQAVVLAPLIVGLGLVGWRAGGDSGSQSKTGRERLVKGLRFMAGVVLVVGIVFAWDAMRIARGAATGFWEQGVDSFGGLRFIWSTELESRWDGWTELGGYVLGWAWAGALFLVGMVMLIWHDLTRQRRTRASVVDLALSTFVLFYCVLHWLVAFPIWDRYSLPLVPIVGLLLGRGATLATRILHGGNGLRRVASGVSRLVFPVCLVMLLMGTGLLAAGGRLPVGGNHGAYDGLSEVMAFLRTLPAGTVLYDRWLSWHFDFYLFDAYLYRAGFPSPQWLATDAATFYDGRPRYLVIPSWESAVRLRRVLAEAGLAMSPVMTTYRRDGASSFVVYEIGPIERDRS